MYCKVTVSLLTEEWKVPGENNAYCKYFSETNANIMIRARTRVSSLTDRLRHGRATVVKLCYMGNRQCLHLRCLL